MTGDTDAALLPVGDPDLALGQAQRACAFARGAMAAGARHDVAGVIANAAAAIDAGLSGEPAVKLLHWIVNSISRSHGLDLIYEKAAPAGVFALYDKLFDAAFLARGDTAGLVAAIERAMGERAMGEQAMGERAMGEQAMGDRRPTFLSPGQTAAREAMIARRLPTVFVNTLPKSGTLFLRGALTDTLGLFTLPVSVRTFPRDHIVPSFLAIAGRGGCLLFEHLDGRRDNLDQLSAAGIDRVHVGVRDPRQTLISWVYHVESEWDDIYSVGRIQAPADFRQRAFADRVDWMIGHYLPHCVQWIGEWVDAAEHTALHGVRINLTDFAEMKADGEGYVRRLLAHFGLHVDGPLPVAAPEAGANHFRRGELDEWRRVCTPEQQAAMSAAVPGGLIERFGWDG